MAEAQEVAVNSITGTPREEVELSNNHSARHEESHQMSLSSGDFKHGTLTQALESHLYVLCGWSFVLQLEGPGCP